MHCAPHYIIIILVRVVVVDVTLFDCVSVWHWQHPALLSAAAACQRYGH